MDQKNGSTVGSFLTDATATLTSAGLATARLDTLVLMEDVLLTNRASLLAYPETPIPHARVKLLQSMIRRRAKHEPLAYIRHKTEFYGREFYIDHRVLEPRPESETMIDLLKSSEGPRTVIDVGTGSGALAITAKLEQPHLQVTAVDIDDGCLAVAKQNARQLGADITFITSDLLLGVDPQMLDRAILLCNLPYVPDSFQINPAAMREPRLAIFGGPDGLDLYRKLFNQLKDLAACPMLLLAESMPPQHHELNTIAAAAGFVLDCSEDFIQAFRTSSGNSAL